MEWGTNEDIFGNIPAKEQQLDDLIEAAAAAVNKPDQTELSEPLVFTHTTSTEPKEIIHAPKILKHRVTKIERGIISKKKISFSPEVQTYLFEKNNDAKCKINRAKQVLAKMLLKHLQKTIQEEGFVRTPEFYATQVTSWMEQLFQELPKALA